jgi:predicted nucleic acid-binding protein
MILIDTSTIVAWLDASHEHHVSSARAIGLAVSEDDTAISVMTLAELAAGERTPESLTGDGRQEVSYINNCV